jgi:hypothetical protein
VLLHGSVQLLAHIRKLEKRGRVVNAMQRVLLRLRLC